MGHSDILSLTAQGLGVGALLGIGWSALVGSAHCALMCGPLALGATAGTGWGIVRYQFGRVLSYGTLGAVAGSAGQVILGDSIQSTRAWVWLGFGVVLLGTAIWPYLKKGRSSSRRQAANLRSGFGFWMQRLPRTPFWIGLASGLLPCGYLHAFLAGAWMSRSALGGSLWMIFVAFGTAPGLFSGAAFARALQKLWPRPMPRWLAPLLLVISGVWSLYHFAEMTMGQGGHHAHEIHRSPGTDHQISKVHSH